LAFFFNPNKLDNKNELYGCRACGLDRNCLSPHMKPFGNFKKQIMIIAQAPGETEDKKGRQLCGKSGNYLKRCLSYYGIDMDDDCLLSNCIACRPPNNRKPKQNELDACFPRLEKEIFDNKPKLIIIFGEEALQQILNPPPSLPMTVGTYRGYVVPSRRYNAWVAPLYHPSYIIRSGGEDSDLHEFFLDDLKNALSYLGKSIDWPIFDEDEGNELVLEQKRAIHLLKSIIDIDGPVAFDYETNTLYPYNSFAKILTLSFASSSTKGYCIPLWHPDNKWSEDFLQKLSKVFKQFLESKTPKFAHNANFETIVSKVLLNADVNNIQHDSMLCAHVLDDRRKITKLDFQAFIHSNSRYFENIDHNNLDKTPLPIVAKYNSLDSRYCWWLSKYQQRKLNENKQLFKAYQIFNGALPLFADLTFNGIKVDDKQLKKLKRYYENKAEALKEDFLTNDICKKFEKEYGHKPHINGRNDGIKLFYDICGLQKRLTKKGNPTLDEETLIDISKGDSVAAEIAKLKLDWSKYNKMITTFVPSIEKWVRDGYLHPTYNLHIARSFRSSSDSPNFQQQPKRNPEAKKIRKCYVPRNDFLLEVDYSGNEVRHLAMLSKDKNLIQFLIENRDFHREWAARIKAIRTRTKGWKDLVESITDDERFEAKNSFVFPSFYGAQPPSISRNLYIRQEYIEKMHEGFWKEFYGVKKFQEKTLDFYAENGYIEMETGFRRYGPLKPTEILNSKIQGVSFHTLLVNLIEIRKQFIKEKLNTKIITQTHDSALFDVDENEEDFVIDLVSNIMTKPIWDWQKGVPLIVKWEKGINWYNMEPIDSFRRRS